MADVVILCPLDDTPAAGAILDEFERRTGLQADVRGDGRYYELRDAGDHEARVVGTLSSIDERWTDVIGFKRP